MANDPRDDQNIPEDQLEEGQVEEQQEDDNKKAGAMAGVLGWVISAVLHGLLIVLAGTIYFLATEQVSETPPVRTVTIDPPPKKEEKPKEQRDVTPTVEIKVATESDKPAPITDIVVPDEKTQSEDQNDAEQPKGREEAVASSEAGGSAAFMAIGAGGGAAGMFGSRSGGGRKRATARGGGTKGSESAVEAALRWFKKHQSPNGSWEGDKYNINCTEDPKCEPGALEGHSPEEVNTAMTGYALLCFLGAGYDHKSPNRFKQTVKKGLDYLVSIQSPDGLLGKRNYEHPVATMALAEAYAMTGDPELKGPAQKGVDIILKRQNQDGKAKDPAYAGMGWDYVGPSQRNDSSVTGWNVMALKSAYAGQLNVGNGMTSSKNWLEVTWKAANPDWAKLDPYAGKSVFPYTYRTDTGAVDKEHLACVGMVCAVFLGHTKGDVMLETLANWVMEKQVPKAYPTNTYFMYYNTLGVFQVGGDKWKTWNTTVRELLVNAQRKGQGCFDGSWDWEGTGFHGHKIGRVLSTAYNCLCLEVYYRYAQVNQGGAKH